MTALIRRSARSRPADPSAACGGRSSAERALGARGAHRADELQGVQPAHELQIVLKTAQGMTNHGIGKALFRSHRTVGAHRYRVFPRLGNTAHPQPSLSALGETSRFVGLG